MRLGKDCPRCGIDLTTKGVKRIGIQAWPQAIQLLGNCRACGTTTVLSRRHLKPKQPLWERYRGFATDSACILIDLVNEFPGLLEDKHPLNPENVTHRLIQLLSESDEIQVAYRKGELEEPPKPRREQ